MIESKSTHWKREIALYLLSQSTTVFGSSVVSFAIVWHITLMTSSSVMLTISILCTFIPKILISIPIGVFADRYDRKVIIILGDAVTAVTTLLLYTALTIWGDLLIIIFAASILRSIGAGMQEPVQKAFLPYICPKEKLAKINGLNSAINSAMQLLAPGVGGVLLATVGLATSMLADTVTALIAITFLLLLKVKHESFRVKTSNPNKKFRQFVDDFKNGVTFLKNTQVLSRILVFYFLFYFIMAIPGFLTPILIERTFGGYVWMLTLNEVFWFSGTLLGGGVMFFWGGFKSRLKTMILSSSLFGIFVIFMGISSHFYVYLLAMSMAGMAIPVFTASNTLLIQENVPADLLGRIFANIEVLSALAMPAGMLIFGPMGDVFSIESLLIFSGTCFVIVSLLILRVYKTTKC